MQGRSLIALFNDNLLRVYLSNTKESLQQLARVVMQSEQDNEDRFAEIVYYKAKSRGFTLGHEIIDWLEAEQELPLSCEG